MTPGPQERRLRNRIIFKLRGRWPASVVHERLTAPWDPTNVNAIMADVYAQAGQEWIPLTGDRALDDQRPHTWALRKRRVQG